jgi:hypothetical protein
MILLRDVVLFVLPALLAAGGWLYALSLRKRAGSGPEGQSRRVPAA